MRKENEMFDLILTVAKKDERIRAAYMNGSRINPNVSQDMFQDYDIVYVVTETASFLKNDGWIQVFGELLMVQEPDKNDQSIGLKRNFDQSYGYLMLFTDGNRIDLQIKPIDTVMDEYGCDKLTIPLLDKDDLLPTIALPTDIDYRVKRPTNSMYFSCCNNFWWCLQNVAKGIWRDELPYAKQMFEHVVREELNKMVSWWIGTKNDFQVSTGKMGKYFKNYLPEAYWELYKNTYSNGHDKHFWDAIFVSCDLFRLLAKEVANDLKFSYLNKEDQNMTNYLHQVSKLPKNATIIFN